MIAEGIHFHNPTHHEHFPNCLVSLVAIELNVNDITDFVYQTSSFIVRSFFI